MPRAANVYNPSMLAIFESLGFSELMIVMVAAILIFGKRLPEVASQAGQQIAKFRRSLQDIKTETGIDNDIRKIQREIQNAVPRDLSMGEMARIASLELEKRIKANDEPIKDVAKPALAADTSARAADAKAVQARAEEVAPVPAAKPSDPDANVGATSGAESGAKSSAVDASSGAKSNGVAAADSGAHP